MLILQYEMLILVVCKEQKEDLMHLLASAWGSIFKMYYVLWNQQIFKLE